MISTKIKSLIDIDKKTVDFKSNYDETEKEPTVLPAQYPNLLVNGAGGIAVGMATSIPPHNLGEVVDGTLALIKNKDIKIKKNVSINFTGFSFFVSSSWVTHNPSTKVGCEIKEKRVIKIVQNCIIRLKICFY